MEDIKEPTNHSKKKIINKLKIRRSPRRDAVTNVMLKIAGRMTRLQTNPSGLDYPKWIFRIRKN